MGYFGEGNVTPLQYSCLENPMEGGEIDINSSRDSNKPVTGPEKFGCSSLHPTPVLLPGKSHGWRSLVGHSPWGREQSDTTERLHFHFSLSCIGEGNGNPLQCSCLENPGDGGPWWAAIHGVSQSWTRLKRRSSSSSSSGRRLLRVPWTARRSNQSILKGDQS